MGTLNLHLDRVAITLSVICAVHCLLLPVLLVMVPALIGTAIGEESFHRWLLVGVVPVSLVALGLGCRHDQSLQRLSVGLTGLVIISIAAFHGHDLFGETGEKVATLVGASLIASSHIWNHRKCRQSECSH